MNNTPKGLTGVAKLAMLLAVLGLSGSAAMSLASPGPPSVSPRTPYPKVSASTLSARRSSSGGGYYRTTRYGTSRRGGGYSYGK